MTSNINCDIDFSIFSKLSISPSCKPIFGDSLIFRSKTALDLLKRLLEKDPTKRISAAEALEHPAIKNLKRNSEVNTEEPFKLESIDEKSNLKEFHAKYSL